MIPISTTTLTVLRRPPPDDGYPDAEPVYAVVVSGVRANFELYERPTSQPFEEAISRSRFVCDPCDVLAFDLVRDDVTGTVWNVEWVQPRPGFGTLAHMAGVCVETVAPVEALEPLTS